MESAGGVRSSPQAHYSDRVAKKRSQLTRQKRDREHSKRLKREAKLARRQGRQVHPQVERNP